MANEKDDLPKHDKTGHPGGQTPLAQDELGKVMTFETTFYDPLLKSLREFYDNEESGNHGFEVISGEDYMRQLIADMNNRDAAKPV